MGVKTGLEQLTNHHVDWGVRLLDFLCTSFVLLTVVAERLPVDCFNELGLKLWVQRFLKKVTRLLEVFV